VHAECFKAGFSLPEIYYSGLPSIQLMVFSAGGWQEKHNVGSELLL
jgi:hypothetical protein